MIFTCKYSRNSTFKSLSTSTKTLSDDMSSLAMKKAFRCWLVVSVWGATPSPDVDDFVWPAPPCSEDSSLEPLSRFDLGLKLKKNITCLKLCFTWTLSYLAKTKRNTGSYIWIQLCGQDQNVLFHLSINSGRFKSQINFFSDVCFLCKCNAI